MTLAWNYAYRPNWKKMKEDSYLLIGWWWKPSNIDTASMPSSLQAWNRIYEKGKLERLSLNQGMLHTESKHLEQTDLLSHCLNWHHGKRTKLLSLSATINEAKLHRAKELYNHTITRKQYLSIRGLKQVWKHSWNGRGRPRNLTCKGKQLVIRAPKYAFN